MNFIVGCDVITDWFPQQSGMSHQHQIDQLTNITLTAILDYTYTQRNFFGILLIQTEIRLYLPFSNRFGSKQTFVKIQISENGIYNLISVWNNKIPKSFCVCICMFASNIIISHCRLWCDNRLFSSAVWGGSSTCGGVSDSSGLNPPVRKQWSCLGQKVDKQKSVIQ